MVSGAREAFSRAIAPLLTRAQGAHIRRWAVKRPADERGASRGWRHTLLLRFDGLYSRAPAWSPARVERPVSTRAHTRGAGMPRYGPSRLDSARFREESSNTVA